MPITASVKGSSRVEYPPTPTGLHRAVCVNVEDIGLKPQTWKGETRMVNKLRITWEIEPTYTYEFEGEEIERNYLVFGNYTLSMHENSNLRAAVHEWLGRSLADHEAAEFDLEGLIDEPCKLYVNSREYEGKTFYGVKFIEPAGDDPLQPSGNYGIKKESSETPANDNDDDMPF